MFAGIQWDWLAVYVVVMSLAGLAIGVGFVGVLWVVGRLFR